MKRAFSAFLLGLLLCGGAYAATTGAPTLSPDKRITMVPAATGHYVRPMALASGVPLVAGNLGLHYPKGEYFCCYGLTVSGAQSPVGAQYSLAIAFTPQNTVAFGGVQIGIGYVAGPNAVAVSLYSDAGGVPGSVITSLAVHNLPVFGACCGVASLPSNQSIMLNAGTQYWVVAQSAPTGWLAWNYNSSDQEDVQTIAVNNGSGWAQSASLPGIDFEVYGR